MSDLLGLVQEGSFLAILFAAVGFFWISFKNWWSNREVVKLTMEDRKLFKEVDSLSNSMENRQKQIDSVASEEADKELSEAVDEWNKK